MCDVAPSLTAGPSTHHGGPPSQQQNGWEWTYTVTDACKALPSCSLSVEQAQEVVLAALATTAAAAHTPLPHQELLADPAALQQLQQALGGVLQLTLLVCCQPSYHTTLAPSGFWASASSRLQDATKQLLGHLQQLVAATSSEEGWQALAPCCATAAELLVELAVTAASLVAAYPCGRAATPPPASLPPKDMASFVLLNLGWASLTRLLSQLRPGVAGQVLAPAALQRALCAALDHGRTAMVHWAAAPTKPQQTVVKFWQQAVAKLAAAAPEAAAAAGPWRQLAATVGWMVGQIRTGEAPIAQEVAGALLPRLMPSLCRALDAATAAGAGQVQECLAALVAGQQQQQQEPDAMELCSSPNSQLQQRLAIAEELLLAAPAAGCEAATTVAQQLLPWALDWVSQQLAASSLSVVDSAKQQDAGPAAMAAGEDPAGPLVVAATSFLLSTGAAQELAAAAEAAGASLMSAVLSPHPLTRHLGAQLAGALLAARPPAAQVAVLEDAWELVADVAAAEAAGAPGWASCSASHQLLPALALWLQVVSPEAATQWLVTRVPGSSSATDAASCAVTVAACCLLELLGPGAAACCQQELVAAADQLCSALQQTLSVAVGAGAGAGDPALGVAAAHQLSWQLEAAASCLAALHLAQSSAGPVEGQLWEAALAAVQSGLGAGGAGGAAAAAAAHSHPAEPAAAFCLPALHLLAQAASTMAASVGPQGQQAAANLLVAAVQQPQLLVAAARVAAQLTRLESPPQALFHTLLSSTTWQVRAAGREALVAVSRAGGGPGFLALLPPAALTGTGAAHPSFVAAFSAALKQEPDALATTTVADAGTCRLRALQQQLMAAVAQPLGSAGLQPLPGWVAAVVSAPPPAAGGSRAAVGPAAGAGGAEAAAVQLKDLAAAARAELAAVAQALDTAEAAVAGFVGGVQDVRAEWGGASAATSLAALRGLAAPLVGDLTSLGSRLRTLTSRLSS